MANLPKPQEHPSVFISYSRQDAAFALRVQATLAAAGIHAWVDQAEVLPGHPDWEDALRHAIKQSQALVLIASPNSRQSRFVKDELDLAHAYQCPVYPLWVSGDIWMEAIPLGWGRTQYIDARGANEPAAVQALLTALEHLLRPKAGILQRLPENATPQQNREAEAIQPEHERHPDIHNNTLTIIDLAIAASRNIGADQHPVSLSALHSAYLKANPGITKGRGPDSFANIVAFHTINMRSRFYYPDNKRKLTQWLTRPVFKRVAYGQYKLLSDDEVRLFRQLFEEGDPRIYQDEYDISDLFTNT